MVRSSKLVTHVYPRRKKSHGVKSQDRGRWCFGCHATRLVSLTENHSRSKVMVSLVFLFYYFLFYVLLEPYILDPFHLIQTRKKEISEHSTVTDSIHCDRITGYPSSFSKKYKADRAFTPKVTYHQMHFFFLNHSRDLPVYGNSACWHTRLMEMSFIGENNALFETFVFSFPFQDPFNKLPSLSVVHWFKFPC